MKEQRGKPVAGGLEGTQKSEVTDLEESQSSGRAG